MLKTTILEKKYNSKVKEYFQRNLFSVFAVKMKYKIIQCYASLHKS